MALMGRETWLMRPRVPCWTAISRFVGCRERGCSELPTGMKLSIRILWPSVAHIAS